MKRAGLSGVASALLITIVLVAGIASASYVNITTVRYNEVQMQEALRQARLGSELIRIHIHSTDGSVDSPPMITFVNAWGFESRVRQLVVIARNMSVLATVNLTQPLVLPAGSRLTLEPSQIGLEYGTFRELADNVRSIHAYTEAGNSFGSTWGFPREDNLAGRTVAVTYNATTTELWRIPSVTWINVTFTVTSYTTIGNIPPIEYGSIRAIHHYQGGSSNCFSVPYGSNLRLAVSYYRFGDPPWPPTPGFPNVWLSSCGSWRRVNVGGVVVGDPVEFEANLYYPIFHGPLRLVVSITVRAGSDPIFGCTADYRFKNATITPSPPEGVDYGVAMYAYLKSADYRVDRYFELVSLQCESYEPPTSPPPQYVTYTWTGPGGYTSATRQECTVIADEVKEQRVVMETQTVTAGNGDIEVITVPVTKYVVSLVTRLIC